MNWRKATVTFTTGQCHALALALHELTGWKIVVRDNPTHVLVEMNDGRLLDINGPKSPSPARAICDFADFAKPDMRVARRWAKRVLENFGLEEFQK